jgi:hypothetical protein
VHDWPDAPGGDLPSPTLVAAWLTLDMLPTERIPLWAAHWLANGHDGAALVQLAGLHGDDPHEVRDLLPAALADCGVTPPATDTAAAMEAFARLARLHAQGKADERWVVIKVNEILARCQYASDVVALPLGQLHGLDDECGTGWGRTKAQLRDEVHDACQEQMRLAAHH